MRNFKFNKVLFLCLLIGCCALSYAQDAAPDTESEKRKTTTTTTTTTTEEVPTTTPSTSTSSSTASTTTTTTTSTTVAPPKTTTTTTTTAAPKTTTTTTVAPTTTTVKPAPYPKPEIGFWHTNCTLVQMAAQFNFTYQTKDNKTKTDLFNLPKNGNLDDMEDNCEAERQQIAIKWGTDELPSSLLIEFEKNGSNFFLYEFYLKFQINTTDYPDAKENQTVEGVYTGNMFKTPLKMSYHCTRKQNINLTDTLIDKKTITYMSIMDVQLEAFRTIKTTTFSTAKDCDAMDTPDIVPIAVGIALIALILIVLISYLVARRRSIARGYMSF